MQLLRTLVVALFLLAGSSSGLIHRQEHAANVDKITKKLMDENAELKAQNEELSRENSLLKVKLDSLEERVKKEKGKIRQTDRSHELKDVHANARLRVCESQVKDLSEALIADGESSRVKEIHERAQEDAKKLERTMLNAKKLSK